MSKQIKSNNKPKLSAPAKALAVKTLQSQGLTVLDPKQVSKMRARETELQAAQRKLTRQNAELRAMRVGEQGKIPRGDLYALTKGKDGLHLKYLATIIDPFNNKGVKIPSDFALPTVCLSLEETREFPLYRLTSPQSAPVTVPEFILVAPIRYNKVWAATGNAIETIASTAYLIGTTTTGENVDANSQGHQYGWYNGSAWESRRYPGDNSGTLAFCESIGGASGYDGKMVVKAFSVHPKYGEVIGTYSHMRLVSAGLKINYMGAPFSAKGRIAIAQLPPGMDILKFSDTDTVGSPTAGQPVVNTFIPTWDNIVALPGCQTFAAAELVDKPVMASIRPYNDKVEEWCPTRYQGPMASAQAGASTMGSYGAPACTTDHEKMEANYDGACIWLESTMADPNVTTALGFKNMMQLFQPSSSYWSSLIIMYNGTDTDASISVDFVHNYECIIDSREFQVGSIQNADSSLATRKLTRRTAAVVPAAHAGRGVGDKIISAIKDGGKWVAGAVNQAGGARSVLAKVGETLGVEVPEIFGDVAEVGMAAAMFL